MSAWKFEAGKQVVCRGDGSLGGWKSEDGEVQRGGPALGDILTVRVVEVDDDDAAWLEFEEWPPKALFEAVWFEPVRTTDISALRDLLAPIDTKELEPV